MILYKIDPLLYFIADEIAWHRYAKRSHLETIRKEFPNIIIDMEAFNVLLNRKRLYDTFYLPEFIDILAPTITNFFAVNNNKTKSKASFSDEKVVNVCLVPSHERNNRIVTVNFSLVKQSNKYLWSWTIDKNILGSNTYKF